MNIETLADPAAYWNLASHLFAAFCSGSAAGGDSTRLTPHDPS
jgi:hypothetical protein